MEHQGGAQRSASDEGISLIEIMIAMAVLTLLSMAFLPMLITGLKLSTSNSTIATASEIASAQMTLARSQTATCAALTSFASASVPTTTDGTGTVLTTTRSVTCPSSYPGTVTFTATVTGAGATKASATTLIAVAS